MNTRPQPLNPDAYPCLPAGYCRLDHYRPVRIDGADARDFLNRQFSCDLAAVSPGQSGFGAWCSPKGRIITLVHIIQRPAGLYLLLPEELLEASVQRLRMFIMRDDVQFQIQPPDAFLILGLQGREALEYWRAGSALEIPDENRQLRHHQDISSLRWPGSEAPRLLLLAGAGNLERQFPDLRRQLPEITLNDWQLGDIRAGLPEVFAATREIFIPQMLNLERIGGVSFTKGCYPGQEIVARTQHLGRIKRRMYIGRCGHAAAAPQPGDNLVDAAGTHVARIVNAARGAGDGWELLAVVPLERVDQSLYLESEAIPVTLREPDYGFSDPE